jgi:hypothetical protein
MAASPEGGLGESPEDAEVCDKASSCDTCDDRDECEGWNDDEEDEDGGVRKENLALMMLNLKTVLDVLNR